MYLRNSGIHMQVQTASQPRKPKQALIKYTVYIRALETAYVVIYSMNFTACSNKN